MANRNVFRISTSFAELILSMAECIRIDMSSSAFPKPCTVIFFSQEFALCYDPVRLGMPEDFHAADRTAKQPLPGAAITVQTFSKFRELELSL
jgi:hypothetical protein